MKEGALAFVKLVFFILFIPLIIAVSLAFQTQILALGPQKEAWLLWGAAIYVATNLFLYNFREVHGWGRMVIGKCFGFAPSVGEVAGFVIPFYSIILILIYLLLVVLGNAERYYSYFLFVLSFSMAMHVVMSAHEIQDTDKSPLKAQYFFGFSFVYILSVMVLALLCAWVISEFSLIAFFKSFAHHTTELYTRIYRLLFVN